MKCHLRNSNSSITKPNQSRSGFTLLELTISIGISSILIAGMTSSLLLAVQANDLRNGPFQEIESASKVLAQIDRELSYATEITTSLNSTDAVEFTLPDQTGDGVEELIRYQWSGVDRAPLERIFNGQAPQVLLPEVAQFGLGIQSIQKNLVGDVTDSPEQTWISQTSSFASSSFLINKNTGLGTDFVPSLPGDALRWSITSVDVRCRRNGNVGNKVVYARVYTADNSREPDQLIDETVIEESNLPTSFQWYSVDFQNVQNQPPGERLCVTFEGENNTSKRTSFQVLDWSFFSGDTWLIRHYNSSKNWSGSPYSDLAIIIRGKYQTQHSVDVDYCQFASVELLTGEQATSAVRSIVQTRNFPQVTGE